MSAANAPRPVTSGSSSRRRTERPTNVAFIGILCAAILLEAPPPLWGRSARALCTRAGRGVKLTAPNAPPPHPSPTRGEGAPWGHLSASSHRAHFCGCGTHRLDDVLISGAAAQVRGQDFDQIRIADVRVALEHAGGEHEKSRRAETALQPVVLHEGTLQRMKVSSIGETLDGADIPSVCLIGEHEDECS